MKRRKFITGLATGVAVGVAGCTGLLDEEIDITAEPAEIAESAANERGYEHEETDSIIIEEQFEVFGEERHLTATTWIASYAKEVDGHPKHDMESMFDMEFAGATVISTPNETVVGQELNPIDLMDTDEMIERFAEEFTDEGLEDITHVDETSVSIFGEETTVDVFEAVINVNGHEEDVNLYVATEPNEDDLVIPIGYHLDSVDEEETIYELMEEIQHPVEPPESENESTGSNENDTEGGY